MNKSERLRRSRLKSRRETRPVCHRKGQVQEVFQGGQRISRELCCHKDWERTSGSRDAAAAVLLKGLLMQRRGGNFRPWVKERLRGSVHT